MRVVLNLEDDAKRPPPPPPPVVKESTPVTSGDEGIEGYLVELLESEVP